MPEKLKAHGKEQLPLSNRVALYYQQVGSALKCGRSMFADPNIVNISCDPRRQISSIVKLLGSQNPSILTVLGDNYPAFFSAMFPKSRIASFDINPNQLELGDDTTYISDIGLPGEMSTLLKETHPDLVFLSNIPDYLPEEQVYTVAGALKTHNISHIMTTEVPMGLDTVSPCGSNLFIKVLKDAYIMEYENSRNSGSRVNLMSLSY